MNSGESTSGIERCDEPNCREWAHYKVTHGDRTSLLCLEHGKHADHENRSLYTETDLGGER